MMRARRMSNDPSAPIAGAALTFDLYSTGFASEGLHPWLQPCAPLGRVRPQLR